MGGWCEQRKHVEEDLRRHFFLCSHGDGLVRGELDLMPVAFNLAEEYQISVLVLTDKQIAEGKESILNISAKLRLEQQALNECVYVYVYVYTHIYYLDYK